MDTDFSNTYYAPVNVDTGVLKILLSAGADPNILAYNHTTCLMNSVRFDDYKAVKVLLKTNARFFADDSNREHREAWFLYTIDEKMLKLVLIKEANAEERELSLNTYRVLLSYIHNVKVLAMLLLNNDMFDAEDMFKSLKKHIETYNSKCVKLLLSHCVQKMPEVFEKGYFEYLLRAAMGVGYRYRMTKLLLAAELAATGKCQGYNMSYEYGDTAFKRAISLGLTDIVKLFIAAGASVHNKITGKTPLMIVAENRHLELVKLFIEYEVDLDVTTDFGMTALMYAVDANEFEIVNLLLESGADTTITNQDGDTALTLARYKQYRRIADLIGEYM